MTAAPPKNSLDAPIPVLPPSHLVYLSDARGVFEHAQETEPRAEHGYCLDDVARALSFVIREVAWATEPAPHLTGLIDTYLSFIEHAITKGGAAHNRLDTQGQWTDTAGGGDWWGRAVGALGTTAHLSKDPTTVARAVRVFRRAAAWETPDLHAQLFAAVGASDALAAGIDSVAGVSTRLTRRAGTMVGPAVDAAWPWPERRLRYANGVVPEALIAGGWALHDDTMFERGLTLLSFLLDTYTETGHLSLTGAAGWEPGEPRPQFDQQPIEAAMFAEACARAWQLTGDDIWREGVRSAWRWFLGDNDSSTPMVDLETGAGFDGLTPTGRNSNRGAESTLAALTTHQLARQVGLAEDIP
ncbi:MAG: glycosyltransferase [Demequina sp.]|uniref:glycosyltransferase n=1 Tax=Demequina sp. TaxID=2050685 RepID=UPI0019C3B4E8|nr:glycosyltransferase [Demequina sp.]MBC7297728.1 glycosyltransferase [Demequina sp.]